MNNAPILAELAIRELGTHETPGPAATARILEYGKYTTLQPSSDEVPWCSDFLNFIVHVARESHPEIDGETRSAAAWSWAEWGVEVPDGEQDVGDVVVFDWTRIGLHGEHVAIWLAEDQDHPGKIQVVGGNQSDPAGGPDAVTRKWMPLAAVAHFRRPRQYNA